MLGVDLRRLVPAWSRRRRGTDEHPSPRRAATDQLTTADAARMVLGAPPTLRDAALDDVLRREGYVVVDLLDEAEVGRLRSLTDRYHSTPQTGWVSDFYHPDQQVKRAITDGLRSIFSSPIERMFVDHRSILHNFVINWPGDGGGLELHQHSSIIDDSRNRSVLMWCAVSRATEENGTLHVIPRSHLIQRGPRPERAESWHEQHEAQLLHDHLVSIPLEPGQALIFDNQLLHCSFANSTDEPRIAAAVGVVPSSADLLYHETAGDDAVRVYRLDPDFFVENTAGDFVWARPDGLEFLQELAWSPTVVTAADLAASLPRGTCAHAR